MVPFVGNASRHQYGGLEAKEKPLFLLMEQSNKSRRELQRCSVSTTAAWFPTGVRRFGADNYDRVTARCRIGSRHRYQAECKEYDEPFTKKEMERAVATCRHTKLATLLTLKVSSSKLAGRREDQTNI
jgi:hypothetical protein